MELNVEFKLINDPEVIVNMWPLIAPGLRESLKSNTDGTTEDMVYQRLVAKRISMAQIFVDDKYSGFITFQMNWTRREFVTMFNIYFDGILPDGGKFLRPEHWEIFEELCRSMGAKGINCYAERKGIEKLLGTVGYVPGAVEMVKEI